MTEEFEVITRHLVVSKDLNFYGNLHGGVMLLWIDEAGYLFAVERIGYANLVTVSLENVRFQTPGRNGDRVIIQGRIARVGRSSLTIQARAVVEDPDGSDPRDIITCDITYVCLKDGRPFSYFKSEEYLSRGRQKQSREHMQAGPAHEEA